MNADQNHPDFPNRCLNCERRILRLHTGTIHAGTGRIRCDGRPDNTHPDHERAIAPALTPQEDF